ncbi:hypothetical protein [Pseudarthrobacter sp. CCNWLW207]|uniref:hypothetical protein n=1 Tax=Pseudarthrobacter sp. CCNWLW207 TaxID=3127468 RepID=UPI0030784856
MTINAYGVADILTDALKALGLCEKPPRLLSYDGDDVSGWINCAFPLEWEHLVQAVDPSDPTIEAFLDVRSPLVWVPPLLGPRGEHIDALTEMLPPQDSQREGSLVVLLPLNALTQRAWGNFRQRLFSIWQPRVVCDIPSSMISPAIHSAFRFMLVLLKPAEVASELDTKFFRFPWETAPRIGDVADDFKRLMRMKGGQTEHGFVVRGEVFDGSPLHFESVDPKLRSMRRELADFGSTRRLDDLYEVLPPGHRPASPGRTDAHPAEEEQRSVRVLQGRDILRTGTIADTDGEDGTQFVTVPLDRQLEPGDFVVRALVGKRPRDGLVLAEVTAEDLPAAAGSGVLVLRPRTRSRGPIHDFVLAYLRSPRCVELSILDQLMGHMRLSVRSLSELLVPYPDEEMITALTHLQEVKNKMQGWQDEADELLTSVFDEESAKAARKRIIGEGRILRQRANEADSLTPLSGRIRKRFPLPLAYRWRAMEAALSGGTSREGYEAILGFFEVLSAYLAQIAVAMAANAGIKLQEVDDIAAKVGAGRGGTTVGDWLAILESTKGKKFRALDDDTVLGEIRNALGPEVAEARVWLKEARNDKAHERPVDDVQLPAAIQAAKGYLDQIMEDLSFLPDLSLRFVSDFQWDDITETGEVSYEELVGDHPVVPASTGTVDRFLEKGSLYIVDPLDRWHRIRPFLVRERCPECKTWSTFYLDRRAGGEIRLKSLEHGHVIVAKPHVVRALEAVSYLPAN